MTTLIISLIALVAVLIRLAGRPVSQGSTKANTVHAIEQANSTQYKAMVLKSLMVDEVLADMQNDPFWADLL